MASRFSSTSRIVVLTGAGVSAESGIATFRDANGLCEQHRVEDVASPEGFAADPTLVWRFYGERRRQAATARPNAAHIALADCEARIADRFFLCTQNVDSLHEEAGSVRVVHMHGELTLSRCSDPRCRSAPFRDQRHSFAELPRCACGALQRPHIVWFGEVPFHMQAIQQHIRTCDWFVTIGSSGVVYPAAGLVREMRLRRERGERCYSIYFGLERPENAQHFDEVVIGKAGDVVPDWFAHRA